MIEKIAIKNFKSFRDVSLKLGPLNIFIGPNASGKSNFFDALRVLQGIGYGFTLREILDGKPKSVTSETWDGIRGGSAGVAFAAEDMSVPTLLQISGRLADKLGDGFEYAVAFASKQGHFLNEHLSISNKSIYEARPEREKGPYPRVDYYRQDGLQGWLEAVEDYPVLKVVRIVDQRTEPVAIALADMQRLDPLPSLLREYSKAYEIKRIGENGENFAAVVRMICKSPETKEAYVSWLRELRPHEVDDVGILTGAIGEPMFMLKEGEHQWPAPVLSDGTLRFAALAAAFFQPDMPGIITIEEIENGINPSRLRLLVELLRSRTAEGKTQVFVTTHSPVVLAWLKPEEYATTFYCKRDEETGETKIVPLSEIPRFNEIVSKQSISDLFAEGWMETAL